MNSIERRDNIINLLLESNEPIKGSIIAKKHFVTRQVIVKDIAILRAKGKNIIATPDGYIINKNENKIKAIIAVTQNEEEMFGEIAGMLMIKNYNELTKFVQKYKEQRARLLSVLTNGVHLHTISAENQDDINLIISELKKRNFIVSDLED